MEPPSPAAAAWARELATNLTDSETTKTTIVVPTHENGVLIERHENNRRWSLNIDGDGTAILVTVNTDLTSILTEPQTPQEALVSYRQFFA